MRPERFLSTALLLLSFLFLPFSALADAPGKFRVGVIAPLSGALAEYGLASRNGIETAVRKHPELFGDVEFLYEDSQWDAKTAVSAFNRLRNGANVSMIYNWGNPTSEAVAPLAEQYKMPLIALTLDPKIARGKKFVIRTTNESADFSGGLSQYLAEKGFKRIGVVLAENSYVHGLYDGLSARLHPDQSLEVIDNYNISDHDFRSTVTKIRGKNFDAVGVFLISGQVSEFYRQLQDQGVKIPTFSTDFFESSTEIRLAKGGMNGAVYTHLGTTEEFQKEYVQRYGNDYQIAYAGNAYDMAMLIGTLFHGMAGKLTSEEIMKGLKQPEDHKGIGGTFRFADTPTAGPHFSFPVRLKTIQGDAIRVAAVRPQ